MKDIAFIDLEASGLGAKSWPIEAGWCFLSGNPQALLIKPHATWPLDQWDEAAFALHGVAYDDLLKAGVAIEEVCTALNEALAGKKVYSDAPDWDGFWFYRLFQAAGVRQEFVLRDFYDVFRNTPKEILKSIVEEANKNAPRAHRAVPDVLHMRALYELAAKQN
ncbi:hypothetical protein PUV54_08400 [Hyphococcus flavus]|uniref:Exonuclease domain-containing protein n=1 Tax=Hyphococcus flavus TaxID=1866326 RepID=A0AAE9ZG53_9PROT|nr:hypothetical protein [Hyphococcus flavus]WDI33215.1 hypothetical protein PUV54_08400 [Hyphococcus flavus]